MKLEPQKPLDSETVYYSLLGIYHDDQVNRAILDTLSTEELAAVYDWAWTEILIASDNRMRRKPRPSCLEGVITA